ncbi:MAG: electron transfer flavoprotein subunit alpha/FixB family protein [Acidimicrobiales bacterium]
MRARRPLGGGDGGVARRPLGGGAVDRPVQDHRSGPLGPRRRRSDRRRRRRRPRPRSVGLRPARRAPDGPEPRRCRAPDASSTDRSTSRWRRSSPHSWRGPAPRTGGGHGRLRRPLARRRRRPADRQRRRPDRGSGRRAGPRSPDARADRCGCRLGGAARRSGGARRQRPRPPRGDHVRPWGADVLVHLDVAHHRADEVVEEDVAGAVAGWAAEATPWAVLVGGTAWGREVGSRVAAALGAGLTGDAVGFEVDDGRLVAWKPAFGGAVVAAIHCSSPTQLATVRVGVLPRLSARRAGAVIEERRPMAVRGRVRVTGRRTEDSVDVLAEARRVVGVGQGVAPERYGELDALLDLLGAELAATRKVTDQGWLPHARQLGITGRSIDPDLYLALGTSGKYNHMVGVRAAGLVVAVNPDATAPVFGFADLGIVGEWDVVVEQLVEQLRAAR